MNKFLFLLIVPFFLGCDKKGSRTSHFEYFQNLKEEIVENNHPIEGYIYPISYNTGDTIFFKIHSPRGSFNLKIQKHNSDSIIFFKSDIIGISQDYTNRSFMDGCNWETSCEFIVPNFLEKGLYQVTIEDDSSENRLYFIKKPDENQKSNIVILANENTWQAYNYWGEGSLYKHKSLTNKNIIRAIQVSYKRPITNFGSRHLLKIERILYNYLDSIKYDFDLISGVDLHNGYDLSNYKVLILQVHPEYWTSEMRENLKNYLQNGGNLMYLAGNGIYWKIVIKNGKIECRKYTDDTKHSTSWEEVGENPAELLGISYTRAGYNTYTPYMVQVDSFWIFKNSGLKKGDLFGNSIFHPFSSGHETDKMNEFSPKNTILIAKGLNREAFDEIGMEGADMNGGADMVYFKTDYGGAVFSTGSIAYTGGLLVDSTVNIITKNVLDSMLNSNSNK